jgi:hypothetical protein
MIMVLGLLVIADNLLQDAIPIRMCHDV